MRIGLLACFLLVQGCTIINYRSDGKIPVKLGQNSVQDSSNPKSNFSFTGERVFYLWGVYPNEHFVFIDRELDQHGISSTDQLELAEYQTFGDALLAIISFGMYLPFHYEIAGKGVIRRGQ